MKPQLFDKNPPLKNSLGLYDYVTHDELVIKGFFGKYFWLSNGKKSDIIDSNYPDIIYPYSENAYQASKFDDPFLKRRFQVIPFKEAILLAWELRNQIRPDWNDIKLLKMEEILLQKFNNPVLKNRLLETGNRYLEETNHWNDQFWGVCNGIGENHLGKILMKIRSSI
jgi:predicted NAD-dependent protein-ADP-ribosyltransferase YbiA (DUF1768 family)